MPILQTTLPFDTNEVVAFLFDFSRCPEFQAGETIASVTIPAVSGLTIGTPAATVAEADGIPAGGAVRATVSGGVSGTTYDIECRATFSGGSVRVVKGRLVAE